MEIIPWKPFGELSSFRNEMDKLWDRFFGDKTASGPFSEEWAPSVDISETKDKIVIEADLPGMETNDVQVNIAGNVLTIKGERSREKTEKDENYYRSERHCGSFQRTLSLPVEVKADKAEAVFDKGVLKVTLPKVEAAKSKQIKIQGK